jgi:hypothetical protein
MRTTSGIISWSGFLLKKSVEISAISGQKGPRFHKQNNRIYLQKLNNMVFMRTYVLAAIMGMMLVSCDSRKSISILVLGDNVRVHFGADKLLSELKQDGHPVQRISSVDDHKADRIIVLGTLANEKHGAVAEQLGLALPDMEGSSEEGFGISSNGEAMMVSGIGESGVLYGAMELVDQLKAGGRLDFSQEMTDQPKMVLRGTAIGLQKTEYLPGRSVYEYPYTPETSPGFMISNYGSTTWTCWWRTE